MTSEVLTKVYKGGVWLYQGCKVGRCLRVLREANRSQSHQCYA